MSTVVLIVVLWLANQEQPRIESYPTANALECIAKAGDAKAAENLPGVMGVATMCIPVQIVRAEHS